MNLRCLLPLAVAASAACGTPPNPVPVPACPSGQRLTAAGDACERVTPATDCPPGQTPHVGSEGCRAVGWEECPAGFTRGPSGWGCEDIVAKIACGGASSPRLGHGDCQPVGDCAGLFPPVEATRFVDSRYSGAQLDGSHFRSLVDALATAPSGAVVAVEEGVYPESLKILRPVRIVGRCAAKVRLTSTSQQYTAIGVEGVGGVTIEGVTIDKHLYAVAAFGGGSVYVRDCVLEDNVGLGVYVSDPGSVVQLERSIIRATRPGPQGGGWGLLVDLGARAALVDSAVVANAESGAVVRKAGFLSLHSTLVSANQPTALGTLGVGLLVTRGGRLEARRSSFAGNGETALIVAGDDGAGGASTADLEDVVVRDTLANLANGAPAGEPPQYLGRGISVQQGGQLTARRCSLRANRELGLYVSGPGSFASLSSSTVEGTLQNADGILGRGVAASGGATLALGGIALVGNREVGLEVTGAGSQATIAGSLVTGTSKSATGQIAGHGVVASAGGRLDAVGSAVVKTDGIGLMVAESTATFQGGLFIENVVGLHVQGGVTLQEVESVPAVVDARSCLVSTDTEFLLNSARVGSGTVPLPPAVSAPTR